MRDQLQKLHYTISVTKSNIYKTILLQHFIPMKLTIHVQGSKLEPSHVFSLF